MSYYQHLIKQIPPSSRPHERELWLIAKPNSCQGCSAYNNSQHWVPDVYVAGSQVLVLQGEVSEYDVKGQQVSSRVGLGKYQYDQQKPQPLLGPDGYDLSESYLGLGKLSRATLSLASTTRCITGLTGKAQQEAATYCQATHFRPPQSIELVVALGPVAAQAMGLEGRIEQWRGHVIEGNSGGSRSA